jgi:hypothetical protein
VAGLEDLRKTGDGVAVNGKGGKDDVITWGLNVETFSGRFFISTVTDRCISGWVEGDIVEWIMPGFGDWIAWGLGLDFKFCIVCKLDGTTLEWINDDGEGVGVNWRDFVLRFSGWREGGVGVKWWEEAPGNNPWGFWNCRGYCWGFIW